MKRIILTFIAVTCLGALLFTGCAGSNQEEKIPDTQNASTITGDADASAEDDTGNGLEPDDTFTDANELFKSADLNGGVSKCTDSGCRISTVLFTDGISSDPGVNAGIVYTDETVFQRGRIKSDGSSYTLTACEKSDLKDGDFILLFGSKQSDDTYLAERIIIAEFDYN